MEKYRGLDYLEIERLLSDDEKLARDSARDFVEREIEPIIRKAEEFMDTSLMAELDKSGFLNAVWK